MWGWGEGGDDTNTAEAHNGDATFFQNSILLYSQSLVFLVTLFTIIFTNKNN